MSLLPEQLVDLVIQVTDTELTQTSWTGNDTYKYSNLWLTLVFEAVCVFCLVVESVLIVANELFQRFRTHCVFNYCICVRFVHVNLTHFAIIVIAF